MQSPILNFITPPIPYYIDCGRSAYAIGEGHDNRRNLGVFDLIVVNKGTLFMGEGESKWALHAGEAIIIRPDLYHYTSAPCTEATEMMWVHFNIFGAWGEYSSMDACMDDLQHLRSKHEKITYLIHNHASTITIPKHFRIPPKALECIEQLMQLEKEPRTLSTWTQQSVFQLFLQHMDRQLTIIQDFTAIKVAEKVEAYIRLNYQLPLTNKQLQQEFNFHPNYLARCMQKVYGLTPMEYLNQYRLDQAKKLLIKTEWSVSRIAEEVGYNQISYFSVCFSRNEAISPLNYRKKYIRHL
ncbi:AraC family transcriptional regulator [Paenibacillus psychroresistens]|uniref:AraC family transcriptional regulator n=1 Tax=Paenibacillus psychroresistens TaxID=1778678 RepID=A0A6B8RDM7_9BACL|nr:AraC family transcriptional regulator [Paenibacillus psychroresistens]QGQ94309.1 AraC family transcriptional regulator [Paenibacillus psychroresistens]